MSRSASPLALSQVAGIGAAAGRDSSRRVAEVHAQARRGLIVTAGFIVAAIAATAVEWRTGWWVPLHLFMVGGLLSAISATTPMLAVTWSAAPAPRPIVAGAQRICLAAGTVAIVVGREAGAEWLLAGGGVAVVAAVVALVPILAQVRHRAATDRFAPAIESYIAAVAFGAVGSSLGIVLGIGRAGTRTAELRGAHLVLNVFGLVGLVIAGTLPYFAATQVRSKLSPRATPTAMRVTFLGLVAATVIAAAGRIVDHRAIAATGLIGYALGLVVIAALLPVYGRGRLEWAGPRVVQLLTGIAWWAAMAVALALAVVQRSSDRVILQTMVIGGFAQIFVASIAYLGPVLRGGGHGRLTRGFAVTRSWVSLVAGNVAAVGTLVDHAPTLVAALAVWFTDVVIRAVRLLAGARDVPCARDD